MSCGPPSMPSNLSLSVRTKKLLSSSVERLRRGLASTALGPCGGTASSSSRPTEGVWGLWVLGLLSVAQVVGRARLELERLKARQHGNRSHDMPWRFKVGVISLAFFDVFAEARLQVACQMGQGPSPGTSFHQHVLRNGGHLEDSTSGRHSCPNQESLARGEVPSHFVPKRRSLASPKPFPQHLYPACTKLRRTCCTVSGDCHSSVSLRFVRHHGAESFLDRP